MRPGGALSRLYPVIPKALPPFHSWRAKLLGEVHETAIYAIDSI
jgi:hypothetical protein